MLSLKVPIVLFLILSFTNALIKIDINSTNDKPQIAIIGAGVIGMSAALAIIEEKIDADITIFYDAPFEKTSSWGPAGLFRLEKEENRKWANGTFVRYADLVRRYGGITGVQKPSGYVVDEDIESLKLEEKRYADIVYDFRYLTPKEIQQFGSKKNLSAIQYTAFTSEGRLYVSWLTKEVKKAGAKFIFRHISSVNVLIEEGYDIVINSAGIHAGEVANDGDDVNVYPTRGILLHVYAPWQKHFIYEDLDTYTIPTIDHMVFGTILKPNDTKRYISKEEREDVWIRNIENQPNLKDAKILFEWVGWRPSRESVRLETVPIKNQLIIHNYGHEGNGFTLGWGCALEVVEHVKTFLK
uniref:FAD dependent oxidoreductase domain-containing protein n=1 Tax=Panagrolaimus sp. PS1159 TaxID=55785 RepID=A0AC35EQV2_9BILA